MPPTRLKSDLQINDHMWSDDVVFALLNFGDRHWSLSSLELLRTPTSRIGRHGMCPGTIPIPLLGFRSSSATLRQAGVPFGTVQKWRTRITFGMRLESDIVFSGWFCQPPETESHGFSSSYMWTSTTPRISPLEATHDDPHDQIKSFCPRFRHSARSRGYRSISI